MEKDCSASSASSRSLSSVRGCSTASRRVEVFNGGVEKEKVKNKVMCEAETPVARGLDHFHADDNEKMTISRGMKCEVKDNWQEDERNRAKVVSPGFLAQCQSNSRVRNDLSPLVKF